MFRLHSPAFEDGGPMPVRCTCEGADRSPPLAWSGLPAGTLALALIVHDPDAPDPAAPQRDWVHWIRYNLSPTSHALEEGAGNSAPPPGVLEARTDAGRAGYHGPCPPIGRHRYCFRLYALDARLPDLGAAADRGEVEREMRDHVLGEAVLMGTYEKTRRAR